MDNSEKHEKEFTIVVNGEKKEVEAKVLSYEDVVNIAFDSNPPKGPNVVITVRYSNAAHHDSGSMLPGDTVEIKKEGTIFHVKATDRS